MSSPMQTYPAWSVASLQVVGKFINKAKPVRDCSREDAHAEAACVPQFIPAIAPAHPAIQRLEVLGYQYVASVGHGNSPTASTRLQAWRVPIAPTVKRSNLQYDKSTRPPCQPACPAHPSVPRPAPQRTVGCEGCRTRSRGREHA